VSLKQKTQNIKEKKIQFQRWDWTLASFISSPIAHCQCLNLDRDMFNVQESSERHPGDEVPHPACRPLLDRIGIIDRRQRRRHPAPTHVQRRHSPAVLEALSNQLISLMTCLIQWLTGEIV